MGIDRDTNVVMYTHTLELVWNFLGLGQTYVIIQVGKPVSNFVHKSIFGRGATNVSPHYKILYTVNILPWVWLRHSLDLINTCTTKQTSAGHYYSQV